MNIRRDGNVIFFPLNLGDEQPDAVAAYDAFLSLTDEAETEDTSEPNEDEKITA